MLKVDTSNMADVYYRPDAIGQDQLEFLADNVKPDRTAEDLLFQVMLDWGVDVTLPIRREEKGFSERNIKQMLAFYREYPYLAFVPQPVAQIENTPKVQPLVALFPPDLMLSIPWGHHGVLMARVKDPTVRLWYMQATIEKGFSVPIRRLVFPDLGPFAFIRRSLWCFVRLCDFMVKQVVPHTAIPRSYWGAALLL